MDLTGKDSGPTLREADTTGQWVDLTGKKTDPTRENLHRTHGQGH